MTRVENLTLRKVEEPCSNVGHIPCDKRRPGAGYVRMYVDPTSSHRNRGFRLGSFGIGVLYYAGRFFVLLSMRS